MSTPPLLHGHTHSKPITRYLDNPRWQELNAEYSELQSGSASVNLDRKLTLICGMRAIEKIYEELEARIALISRILWNHPAGDSLSSTEAETLAREIALKLI